jgi:hypothetical protein
MSSTCGPTSDAGGTRAVMIIVRFAHDYIVGFEHRDEHNDSSMSSATGSRSSAWNWRRRRRG